MNRATLALALVGTLTPAVLALAAAPIVVSQSRRSFSIRDLTIKRGDMIRFANADEFLHHIYVHSPAFSFNSGEQEPGRNVDVAFPVAGTFEVRCEVHPKMLLDVTVQ